MSAERERSRTATWVVMWLLCLYVLVIVDAWVLPRTKRYRDCQARGGIPVVMPSDTIRCAAPR